MTRTELEIQSKQQYDRLQELEAQLKEANDRAEHWAGRWLAARSEQTQIKNLCELTQEAVKRYGQQLEGLQNNMHTTFGVLKDEDVQWVVNDMAEVGVKIGEQVFFCYKGESIQYGKYRSYVSEDGKFVVSDGHDNSFVVEGGLHVYRPVEKRELGETLRVLNKQVHFGDSDEWVPLPAAPEELRED